METLRDIGLEDEAVKHGHLVTDIGPWYRFSNTMTSGELFRRFAFGSDPKRQVSQSIGSRLGRRHAADGLLAGVVARTVTIDLTGYKS